jgi:hypothetical protein
MGSTNETPTEGSSGNSSPRTPAPGTEAVATRLEEEGYEIDYRGGGLAVTTRKAESVAHIELEVTKGEKDAVEDLISEVAPSVPHRLIGPDETAALPDWDDSPPAADIEDEKRPLYIVPAPSPSPSPSEKAQHRASSL